MALQAVPLHFAQTVFFGGGGTPPALPQAGPVTSNLEVYNVRQAPWNVPNDGTAAVALINVIIAAIGGQNATIYFPPGDYGLDQNLVFPPNIRVWMEKGAFFAATVAGRTLTINGDLTSEAGAQIFSSAPFPFAVVVAKQSPNPLWWGATGNGATDDSGAFGSADTASSSPATAPAAVAYRIAVNLTLASHWKFVPGAILRPAAGVTVVVDGVIEAGGYQIFDQSLGGQVVFGPHTVVERILPQWWGAKGDAATDSTDAFNAAIVAANVGGGGTVWAPRGTYVIDPNYVGGKSIQMLSNVNLELAAGAVLQAKTNGLAISAVIRCITITDFEITGGSIVGDRATHGGTPATDVGHGVMIQSAAVGSVHHIHIRDCQGDGIYIGATSPNAGFESTDITIGPAVTSDNNRRQGMSIVAAKRCHTLGNSFTNTNANAPSAGIDFEPNAGTAVVQDCSAIGNAFENNVLGVALASTCKDITVEGNHFRNNSSLEVTISVNAVGAKVVNNSIIHNNAATGSIYNAAGGAEIKDNKISGTMIFGIQDGGTGDSEISGNRITNSGVANSTGILVNAGADRAVVDNNKPISGFKHGIDFAATRAIITRNRCRLNSGSGIHGGGNLATIAENHCDSNTLLGIQISSGNFSNIRGNTCDLNGDTGISVTTAQDSAITGNICNTNSQTTDNLRDNIAVTGDRNLISGNTVRIGALANRPRMGINVSAGATFAQVIDNDTQSGGFTREINDAGTSTVVTNKAAVVTLVYAAAMTPAPFAGQKQLITVTDLNAMAINAPADNGNAVSYKGMRLAFEIANNSGGVMGAITWNAAFHLAGAFVNPATGKTRTIVFVSNGAAWIEESRAAADI